MAHSNGESTEQILAEDRISGLPWHILTIILSYLPILDLVKTSKLSRDWRRKWFMLSDFKLDSCSRPFRNYTPNYRWEIFASVVNQYLRHHDGPITKFKLRTNFNSHDTELCHWLQYLSTQNVEELSIQESGRIISKIPSYLFSFRNLYKLKLTGCSLRIPNPSDFGGFTFLREAFFSAVTVEGDYLNGLIRSCLYLEVLTLLKMSGVRTVRIHAPRLYSLYTDTSVGDIIIGAAPCLTTAAVLGYLGAPRQPVVFNSYGIIRSLLSLGSIRQLIISGEMIKRLAVDYGFENFPWRNRTPTTLMFDGVRFETVGVVNFCLPMLNCCPNVKSFIFSVRSAKGKKLIVERLKQVRGQLLFPELRSLEMRCLGDVGIGCSFDFLEYISVHSPNLRVISIVREGRHYMDHTRVSNMLNRLKEVCPQALVQYVHPGERHFRV